MISLVADRVGSEADESLTPADYEIQMKDKYDVFLKNVPRGRASCLSGMSV